MHTKKSIIAIALLFAFLHPLAAQNMSDDIKRGITLYQNGMYSQASAIFSNYKDNEEAAGYNVLCLTCLRAYGYREAILTFEDAHPSSGLLPKIYYQLGLNLFEDADYPGTLQAFSRAKTSLMEEKQKAEFLFKKAYSLYFNGKADDALALLEELRFYKDRDYNSAGAYLAGYIHYEKGRFPKAEEYFSISIKDQRFKDISSYYIADCHFRRKDYKYLTSNADALFAGTAPERRPSLARMLSESFLVLGNTEKAQEYYRLSQGTESFKTRNDWFYAGSLMFASGDYRGAIDNFTKMEERTDSLGQIAEYQLGYSYIKTGDKVSALACFKAASALNYDPTIKEDAHFNGAKLAFDLNHDASVFNSYIAAYPAKEKSESIFEYMALAALYNKDYARAIEEYDKIEELNPDQRRNYMKANYLRANQLITGGAWRDAVPCLQAVSYYSDKRSAINQLARYWMAEAAFRDGDMPKARSIYSELYNASALDTRPEGKALPYNIAYTYLREDNTEKARRWLNEYISSKDKQLRPDAIVRVGDCYYVDKLYKQAADTYKQAVTEFGTKQDAYALYRQGLSLGLAGDNKAKAEVLSAALDVSEKVPFRNDAVYELGRSYMAVGNNAKAEDCFKNLVSVSSDTTMIARSLVGLGMIYASQKQYDKAVEYYKKVVSELPEAQYTADALLALESVYLAMGKGQEYVNYIDSLGQRGSRSEEDKERIFFSGAEQSYLAGNWEAALSDFEAFKQKYPQSQNVPAADFYIAGCHSSLGNKDHAVDSYNALLSLKEVTPYHETAALELGRLLYGMERFADAYTAFSTLYRLASFPSNRHIANLGKMESSYKARNFDSCIQACNVVLVDSASTKDELFEAKYIKAKSLQRTSKRDEAFVLYKELSSKPDTDYGAESFYLLILDAYDRGDYASVEDLVFAFGQTGSSKAYYIAKSFIILGDSYADQDQYKKAKATFQSIKDGYKSSSQDDDIMEEVTMRLSKLEEIMAEQS